MDPVTNGLDPDRFLRDVYMVNAGVSDPDKIASQRSAFPVGTGLSAIVSPGGHADQADGVQHQAEQQRRDGDHVAEKHAGCAREGRKPDPGPTQSFHARHSTDGSREFNDDGDQRKISGEISGSWPIQRAALGVNSKQ